MSKIIEGELLSDAGIRDRKVAVIGYGNQGRSQALNLRDSGIDVRIGLYPGSGKWAIAKEDGLLALETADAVQEADFSMLCLPDTKMSGIYAADIEPHLSPGKTLAFSHGFNIRFGLIVPPPSVNTVLVGPKGTGPSLRAEYQAGRGIPALVAVHHDSDGTAMEQALGYAAAVGAKRAFAVTTTFAEETESDLFGEQAVLCGGIPELIKQSIDTLVSRGIAPEVAYFECLSDAKLVFDLLYERGFEGMRQAISDTAEWGGLTEGPFVIDDSVRTRMESVLDRIQSGEFARKWQAETEGGMEHLRVLRETEAKHPIEAVAKAMRARMKR